MVLLFCPIWITALFLITMLILIFQGRPIFFKQPRVGHKGKIIFLYKFCTMNNKRDNEGKLLCDELRLTRLGVLLRKLSLDELPSFFNVILNDLSLVGPRPFISKYLNLYSEEQMKRHDVLPGITGWAQINGRNEISWEQKFQLDIWYVQNQSFALDIKILLITVVKVFSFRGINGPDNAFVEEFKGSKN